MSLSPALRLSTVNVSGLGHMLRGRPLEVGDVHAGPAVALHVREPQRDAVLPLQVHADRFEPHARLLRRLVLPNVYRILDERHHVLPPFSYQTPKCCSRKRHSPSIGLIQQEKESPSL